MRTCSSAENVVRGLHIRHPVTERFVNGVLERLRPLSHTNDFRAEHLHAGYVECLTFGVFRAHIDRAVQAQQRRGRCGGNAVLSGSGLSDDTGLAQFLCEQRLSQHVVDLVGSGMVEVLALEEDSDSPQIGSKARCFCQQ